MTPLAALQLAIAMFALVGIGVAVGQFKAQLTQLQRELRDVRLAVVELRRDLDQRTLRRRDVPEETRYERPKTPLPLPPADEDSGGG